MAVLLCYGKIAQIQINERCIVHQTLYRPQFFVFPGDEEGASLDDQFYVGSSGLLVKPVTSKGTTETTVYLSDKQVSPINHFFT